MPLMNFDLREVYSGEDEIGALNSGTVRKYFSMGAEGLLRYCEKDPIQVVVSPRWKMSTIRNGNHRAKALLKHGIYVMACEFEIDESKPMSWSVTPVKLADIPEIEDKKYAECLKNL